VGLTAAARPTNAPTAWLYYSTALLESVGGEAVCRACKIDSQIFCLGIGPTPLWRWSVFRPLGGDLRLHGEAR